MNEKLQVILSAIGLMLVLEGLVPFALPEAWSKTMQAMTQLPAAMLRAFGLVLMLVGTMLVWLIK